MRYGGANLRDSGNIGEWKMENVPEAPSVAGRLSTGVEEAIRMELIGSSKGVS